MNIWTDGSAKGGSEYGGAGVLAMRGEGRKEITAPAGRFTTSFHAEMKALQIGLQVANQESASVINVFTDSQSTVRHLMDGPGQSVHGTENSIWEEIQHLTDRGRKLHIQWVPGHAGLEFNEQVDEIAKRASEEPQDEAEVPLEAANICNKQNYSSRMA